MKIGRFHQKKKRNFVYGKLKKNYSDFDSSCDGHSCEIITLWIYQVGLELNAKVCQKCQKTAFEKRYSFKTNETFMFKF